MDDPAVQGKRAAGDAFAGEADVLALAERREALACGGADAIEEAAHLGFRGRERLVGCGLDGVERVAAKELREVAREGRRGVEELEADRPAVDRHHRALLPRRRPEGAHVGADVSRPALIGVAHREGVGPGAAEGHLVGDVGPDLGLVGAAGLRARHGLGDLRHLARPRPGEKRPSGAGEVRVVVAPAPLLDAGHRDDELLPAADQDGQVENPVLSCADELVAVDEEDLLGARVLEGELGNAAFGRDLAHARELALERVVEEEVARRAVELGDEREEREVGVDLGGAELEAGEGFGDELHEYLRKGGSSVRRVVAQAVSLAHDPPGRRAAAAGVA